MNTAKTKCTECDGNGGHHALRFEPNELGAMGRPVSRWEDCEVCAPRPCPECEGDGERIVYSYQFGPDSEPCTACGGTGDADQDPTDTNNEGVSDE